MAEQIISKKLSMLPPEDEKNVIRMILFDEMVAPQHEDLKEFRAKLAEESHLSKSTVASIGAWATIYADEAIARENYGRKISHRDVWNIAHISFTTPPDKVNQRRDRALKDLALDRNCNVLTLESIVNDFELRLVGAAREQVSLPSDGKAIQAEQTKDACVEGGITPAQQIKQELRLGTIPSTIAEIDRILKEQDTNAWKELQMSFFQLLGNYVSTLTEHLQKDEKELMSLIHDERVSESALLGIFGTEVGAPLNSLLDKQLVTSELVAEGPEYFYSLNPLLKTALWVNQLDDELSKPAIIAGLRLRAPAMVDYIKKTYSD